jgi:ADP-ribose pyrophosphatase YjhB (NUDIX family)
MTRRVTVRGIVLHEGKLLGVKLKPYKDHLKRDNSYWCLPGGGLDEGEALLDGIKREMLEEIGIAPIVGNLLYVQQFSHGHKDYLEFFSHIINGEDYLDIDLSKTTHGLEEIEEVSSIDPASMRVLPEFLRTEDLERQVSDNAATKIISRL